MAYKAGKDGHLDRAERFTQRASEILDQPTALERLGASTAKLLTRDEAFLIAVNIAKLPSLPRQILKDIPRPPNSASRDD